MAPLYFGIFKIRPDRQSFVCFTQRSVADELDCFWFLLIL